jgi:hypothetical protein
MALPPLAWILVGLLVGIAPVTAVGPGTVACTNLTMSLGSSKVVSNPANPEFTNSQTSYWNTMLDSNVPSCVVYPTSAQDVSTSIQAIRAAQSDFAIKAGQYRVAPLR